jgi:histidinol dehydrogenase
VRIERLALGDPGEAARAVRRLVPAAESVAAAVSEIVARVRAEGDRAVLDYTARFDTDGTQPWPLRVDAVELDGAAAALDDDVRAVLNLAIANVRAVALAGVRTDSEVRLPQGQRVIVREQPVRSAGVYVPGGRAPYPSSVVMGVVTAQAAGVERVAVCAPPMEDGQAHPAILAACAACGVDEVHRMGGAQAVAALAIGTESVERVDVIVGPGNLYVQEAKRQLSDEVGIDGFAGPSELLVVLDGGADLRIAALDLLAQAEHGPGTFVAAACDDPGALDRLETEIAELAAARPTAAEGTCALVTAPDLDAALAFAEELAPEHLQLVGRNAESLAPRVARAGCLFVGAAAGTAFGDYVAGSNHVLPTGGTARFASGLSARHFRRSMAEVHLGDPSALAAAGAALADAEGFPVHAESMRARIGDNQPPR